ncbi:MAG: D-lactate dehydrogenase VanH-A [Clostridiales Family XIII bacterium]|jgi:D-specific alpha-keto acid dehydrogenase|nr:D-lactate dehydrogenase VanH-A [Clostridiales Family XIII bacterium]
MEVFDVKITVFGCDVEERELFLRRVGHYGVGLNIVDGPVSTENALFANGSRCVSVSHRDRLCEATLRALKNSGVKLVTTRSVGTDHIDMAAAGRLGIAVRSIPYSPSGVADYAVMLILMALRGAKDILGRAERGDFSPAPERSPDIGETTVGVVGAGRIGREVISRLRPFGCRILAYDRAGAPAPSHGAQVCPSFGELAGQCDILTFHLPLTAQTRHILSHENMCVVKDGAYIVNTGRGGLIETEALLDALKSGKLRGAALDVVEGEEDIFCNDRHIRAIATGSSDTAETDIGERAGTDLSVSGQRRGNEPGVYQNETFEQLRAMPNVIITPHMAYYTRRTLQDTVENTILRFMEFESARKRWEEEWAS